MKILRYPFDEKSVRALRCGDAVRISGRVFTGRDRVHKFLFEGGDPGVDFRGGAIFHCGPIMLRKEDGSWGVVAAGPTTSIREEPYMADVIRRHGLRLVLGKGGMGRGTAEALRECGCAYVQIVGGAAAALASCVSHVGNPRFLGEFGATEAIWPLEVENLEGIVGMDSVGGDLFRDIAESSRVRLEAILAGAATTD